MFSHALWWEAARKLYEREKTWTDKKFAETIIPLLSHEDYPLLTDAELIVKLFQWLPKEMSFALLEYITPLCSWQARWHFHTEEEMVEILSNARNSIVDLMAGTKAPFTKEQATIMAQLLSEEKSIILVKEQTAHIAKQDQTLMRKLYAPFLDSDPLILEGVLSMIYDDCYTAFHHGADERTLDRSEKALQSLGTLAKRHHLDEHQRALVSGIHACREWYRNPSKAARLFYQAVGLFPRTGYIVYNYVAVFLEAMAMLPFPRSKLPDYILLASHVREEVTRADDPEIVLNKLLVSLAEISLALRSGSIADARDRCEKLLALRENIWDSGLRLRVYYAEARVRSIEGERDKALMLIREIFSKFTWRDDMACLKSLATTLLTIEEWGYFETLWQEHKHNLLPRYMATVLRLVEARFLMCLLLGNNEGISEVRGMFTLLREQHPMVKKSIEESEKKTNLFWRLKSKHLAQAKKKFDRFLSTVDTLSPFDLAYYAQLFARIGIQYGHDPKEFTSYVDYSLKEFARLGINKRVVFTAEKFYEAGLISEKELNRIRKKHRVTDTKKSGVSEEKKIMSKKNISGEGQHRHDVEGRGITVQCVGGIQAFDPNGKEIVDRWWGKRKSLPSYHKRIVVELVCAKLERRIVTREELLTILDSSVERGTISDKKKARLDRALAACLSQIRKMFSPYNIIEKTSEGYRLDKSVDIDLFAITNGYAKLKELSRAHPPSAYWQIRKYKNLLKSEIAPWREE